jgi:UDP-N-acetylglucosamine 1-carboxyvinyltransferase
VSVIEELIRSKKGFSKLIVKPCVEIKGKISISGAKNSALPLLAASLLTKELILDNFPFLLDTLFALKILEILGKEVEIYPTLKKVVIRGDISSYRVPYELSSLFRGSVLFLGGLLGTIGKAEVAHPGGCSIGSRPIDQHLKFFENLGGRVLIEGGYIKVNLPERAKNRKFKFDIVTVTGTENALLALTFLPGEYILENVALEPEVLDLISFLKKLGIGITQIGRTFKVFVPPKGRLRTKSTHKVIPDRIEAGTFAVIGALLGNPLRIENVEPEHLRNVLEKLTLAGAKINFFENSLEVYRIEDRPLSLEIETEPYPGFPTDMQAQFMAMLSVANGVSKIVENLFENRFQHALELARMGADISIRRNVALIRGVEKLTGVPVKATDLRASASLVIAGLIAKGETEISNIFHLLRGYEDMDKKLNSLGCDVFLL